MNKLSNYEKETILLTSEGDTTSDIYTFKTALKRKLAAFAEKYPQCCQLKSSTKEGTVTFLVDKSRVSIRLVAPLTDEQKNARLTAAKRNGLIKV